MFLVNFHLVFYKTYLISYQTTIPNGTSTNSSGSGPNHPSTSGGPSGHGNSGNGQGNPGGPLGHGGPLTVALVHDIPLHAHLMPPLTHHGGHLSNHVHHQVHFYEIFSELRQYLEISTTNRTDAMSWWMILVPQVIGFHRLVIFWIRRDCQIDIYRSKVAVPHKKFKKNEPKLLFTFNRLVN